jgi:hypothetical protein
MLYQFNQHYTRDEARALLPQVRAWLKQLSPLRKRLGQTDERLRQMLTGGHDVGGETVNGLIKCLAQIKRLLQEFQRREIQIKDLDRGLIDFPAIIGGREVFLCWEKDEEDIEFWHDLDAGYAGRERL